MIGKVEAPASPQLTDTGHLRRRDRPAGRDRNRLVSRTAGAPAADARSARSLPQRRPVPPRDTRDRRGRCLLCGGVRSRTPARCGRRAPRPGTDALAARVATGRPHAPTSSSKIQAGHSRRPARARWPRSSGAAAAAVSVSAATAVVKRRPAGCRPLRHQRLLADDRHGSSDAQRSLGSCVRRTKRRRYWAAILERWARLWPRPPQTSRPNVTLDAGSGGHCLARRGWARPATDCVTNAARCDTQEATNETRWITSSAALRQRMVNPVQLPAPSPEAQMPPYMESFLAHLRVLVGVPSTIWSPIRGCCPTNPSASSTSTARGPTGLVDGAIAVGKIGTREQAHHQAHAPDVQQQLDLSERIVRILQRGLHRLSHRQGGPTIRIRSRPT